MTRNAAAAIALLVASNAWAQDKIQWTSDYDQALKTAQKESKYVVVHFMGSD